MVLLFAFLRSTVYKIMDKNVLSSNGNALCDGNMIDCKEKIYILKKMIPQTGADRPSQQNKRFTRTI